MFNPQPKPVKKAKKPKRIPPRSKKRAKEERIYREKTKPEFMQANPFCAVCGGVAIDVHHMVGRDGWRLNATEYFLAVCRCCHDRIELNHEWAKEQGYSINRLGIRKGNQ